VPTTTTAAAAASAPAAAGAAAAPGSAASAAGKPVPDLVASFQSELQWTTSLWQKIAADGEKIGLKYKLQPQPTTTWLNAFYSHTYGDTLTHQHDSIDYRDTDATEDVVVRVHSREAQPPLRNIGEYANPVVDKLAETYETELDPQKRLEAAYEIQEIIARDYYYWCACTGPNPIMAYNSADWDGAVSRVGASVMGYANRWTFTQIRPKTSRKRLIVAVPSFDKLSSYNPFGPTGVRGYSALYWDKLLQIDPNLKVIPWVVTAWQLLDPLTWELTIRDGMTWHDGRPATAEDVAFTFNYMAKWKPSFYDVVWQTVQRAEAVNATTVRLHTVRPAANMVSDLLIRTPLTAKHIWENVVETQGVKDPSAVNVTDDMIVGTGSFKWDHYTSGVEILLMANPNHWMPPKIDELLLVGVPTLDATLGKLANKEIDMETSYLTPSQADGLRSLPHITIDQSTRTLNPFIVPFFTQMPWRDPVFRRAWHRTIDKDHLVNVLWEGAGQAHPYNTLLAPAHPFFNPNISTRFDYNLDEAKKILTDGGYTWSSDARLVYPSSDNQDFVSRSDRMFVGG
jgi:peptide/nickel transport system substrate-binding protein